MSLPFRRPAAAFAFACLVFVRPGLAPHAAAAVVRTAPEAALAPLGVPALILGDPANMPAVLAQALQAQSALVASLPAPEVAPHLIALAASRLPVERAAAKLITRWLAMRPDGPAAAEPGLLRLADAAKGDPAFAFWFDGTRSAKPPLGLEGLAWSPPQDATMHCCTWEGPSQSDVGMWSAGNVPLERLGQGSHGFVDRHHAIEGAVIKTVAFTAQDAVKLPFPLEEQSAAEETTARLLASADAGPRHFGRAEVAGQLVSVRERIYGDTLEELTDERKFGSEEQELVIDLARRIAAAGVMFADLRPPNIMIGRTLLDLRRRAYVVDGGPWEALPAGLDADARLYYILHEPIALFWSPNARRPYYRKSLTQILGDSLGYRP